MCEWASNTLLTIWLLPWIGFRVRVRDGMLTTDETFQTLL